MYYPIGILAVLDGLLTVAAQSLERQDIKCLWRNGNSSYRVHKGRRRQLESWLHDDESGQDQAAAASDSAPIIAVSLSLFLILTVPLT